MKERRLLLHHDTATITVCGMGMARKTKLNDLQQALESKIGGLSQPMDRFEKFLHLVIEATAKARKLRTFALDSESKAKVNGLMERVQKSRKTMEALNRASTSNGKGLDKATSIAPWTV